MKLFENLPPDSSEGHILGYITDFNTPPKNSVIGCSNMDFKKSGDTRRQPFSLYKSYESILPENYSIIAYTEKSFTDSNGIAAVVKIICTKNTSDPNSLLKIYLDNYYNAAYGPENSPFSVYENGDTNNSLSNWRITNTTISNTNNGLLYWEIVTEIADKVLNIYKDSAKTNLVSSVHFDLSGTYTLNPQNGSGISIQVDLDDDAPPDDNDASNILSCSLAVTGWSNSVIELTEYYKHNLNSITFTAGTFTLNGVDYNLKSNSAGILKYSGYYNGFFFGNAQGRISGIVEESILYDGWIYFKIKVEQGVTVVDNSIISRYPVNNDNYSSWSKITKISIDKDSESIRLYCGKSSYTLWIGYINNRRYFGGFSISEIAYNGTPSDWLNVAGVYSDTQDKNFKIKCTYKHSYSIGGTEVHYTIGFSWTEDNWATTKDLGTHQFILPGASIPNFSITLPIAYSLTASIAGNYNDFTAGSSEAVFSVNNNGVNFYRNGFYLDFDSPIVLNKKRYIYNNDGSTNLVIPPLEIGTSLGISYDLTRNQDVNAVDFDRIYSLCIQLDGLQTFFIKNCFCGNKYFLKIYLNLQCWFNRRITGHYLLYHATNNLSDNSSHDRELPDTLMLNDFLKGFFPVNEIGVTVPEGTTEYQAVIINQDNETGANKPIKDNTSQTSLSTLLNNKYSGDVHLSAQNVLPLGQYNLIYNPVISSVNNYEDVHYSNPNYYIALSQLQKGSSPARSVNTLERLHQVSKNSEILGIANISQSSLLVFCNDEYIKVDIANFAKFQVSNKKIFHEDGLLNPDSLVIAKMDKDFNLIFWISSNGINVYAAGETKNILEDKWKKEFLKLSDSVISQAFGKYYPLRKEIWYRINSRICIYNIEYNHFKWYDAGFSFTKFETSLNNDILLISGNKIYYLEHENTASFKDYNGTAIDFYILGKTDNQMPKSLKIPHSATLLITSKIEEQIESTPYPASVNFQVSSEDTANDVFNKTLDLNEDNRHHRIFQNRIPTKYFTWKISPSAGSAIHIITFEINYFEIISKITGKYFGG